MTGGHSLASFAKAGHLMMLPGRCKTIGWVYHTTSAVDFHHSSVKSLGPKDRIKESEGDKFQVFKDR